MTPTRTGWLRPMSSRRHLPMARLIVFPHAGSGPASLLPLLRVLPAWTEVLGVVLPGREDRIDEAPEVELDVVLDQVAEDVAELPALPTVLFGHSMGALLAALLAARMSAQVTDVVLSGQAPVASRIRSAEEVLATAGLTPPEVLDDDEWQAHLLRLVRADGELATEARRRLAGVRIPVRATVLGGLTDPLVAPAALEAWRQHVPNVPKLFEGGHFFLLDDGVTEQVAAEITSVLRNAAARVEW